MSNNSQSERDATHSLTINVYLHMSLCVFVCVCVCVRSTPAAGPHKCEMISGNAIMNCKMMMWKLWRQEQEATAACCLLPATLWGVVANFNSPKPEHHRLCAVPSVRAQCNRSSHSSCIWPVASRCQRSNQTKTKTKPKRRRNESQSIDWTVCVCIQSKHQIKSNQIKSKSNQIKSNRIV